MHRIRMALPFFGEFGWEPLLLTIDPSEQEGIKDEMLAGTIPASARRWQAGCVPKWMTAWAGLRDVGLRSLAHLAMTGDRIIRTERPAVALFSTTMFPVMALGRYWAWRHELPYILDIQDPWFCDSLRSAGRMNWKRQLVNFAASFLEPFSVLRAAHVVAVSPGYVETFRRRYPAIAANGLSVLPFGAAETDYAYLRASRIHQRAFDPFDGKRHWVYVGRGGKDMAFALRSLFQSLQHTASSQPRLLAELRLHFIGTDYASKERATKTIEPLAHEFGLGEIVTEITDRIPYFEALQCLLDAHALIVPGSDDPQYTASKIYPYVLSRKPILAIFHSQSTVVDVMKATGAGTVVTFNSGDSICDVAARISATTWLQQPLLPATVWSRFEPYTAREMTRRLCLVFDSCGLDKAH
jgi:hypothetical protein